MNPLDERRRGLRVRDDVVRGDRVVFRVAKP
jgi:hypothetical protein